MNQEDEHVLDGRDYLERYHDHQNYQTNQFGGRYRNGCAYDFETKRIVANKYRELSRNG